MKVAIYARVSTDKQDNGNQLLALREFASKQEGWQIVAEYTDTVSGSGKQGHPQFDAMMSGASRHEFDLLLFWKLDRLTREGVRKTLVILTRLDSYGVKWRSFMEQWFDSCGLFRDAVISIMATLAEQERIAISERTKAGLARAKAKGKILGAAPKHMDLSDLAERRDRGHTVRKIAKDMGVSTGFVMKHLKRLNAEKGGTDVTG